jgi:hypothetical protein
MDADAELDLFAAAAASSSDRVEWRLYVDSGGGDAEPSERALADALAACLAHVVPHVQGYIWQQDPFALAVLPSEGGSSGGGGGGGGPACLGGAAHVGDAVEDEWFITWLLFDLTRALPQLTARRESLPAAHTPCFRKRSRA